MNEIPQEIVDNICSHLDHDNLKSVLLLSRKFQYAAEEHSKVFQTFCLTTGSIDKFVETYTGRHFRYLRQLEFRTPLTLPEDPEDQEEYPWDRDNYYRESREELKSIDESYTQQIKQLFTAIHTVETQECNKMISGNIDLKLFTPTMEFAVSQASLQRSFVSWRVHLLMPEMLPELNFVRQLTIENPYQRWYCNGPVPSLRKLDLRAFLDLSDRLPNLSTLDCRVGENELLSNTFPSSKALRYITQDWIGPQKDSHSSLRNLRHARLDFLYPDYIDHRLPMPDFVAPALHDIFSTSLRILSEQLRTMYLCVIADATLFWPGDGSTPHWPYLEHLHVKFHMSTPSGSWYFDEPAGVSLGGAKVGYRVAEAEMYPPVVYTEKDDLLEYETDNVDLDEAQNNALQYRVVPNNAALIPFLTGFAKATLHMPRLRTFALWSPLSFDLGRTDKAYENLDFERISNEPKDIQRMAEFAWGIAYTGPYERVFNDDNERDVIGKRQMWWRTSSWRPEAELHELFQRIRGEYVTDRSDWFDNQGLRNRTDFENHRNKYF
jgi:hypothetical protein